ncbi:MAG: hypothetical protein NVV63_07440 [Opitutus sp.]|nr:hypothetical protein [Opitutus sp.]
MFTTTFFQPILRPMAALVFVFLSALASRAAESAPVSIASETFTSTVLRGTRTGLDPVRRLKVLLPPGYADSGKAYPVVYFCHSIFQSPEHVLADGNLLRLVERGFASGKHPSSSS